MPRLIALEPFPYASRNLRAGEEFEASASDAAVLCRIGRAKEAPRRAESLPLDEPGEPEKQGRYRRRDMRATD